MSQLGQVFLRDRLGEFCVALVHLQQVAVFLPSVLLSAPHLILKRSPSSFQLLLQTGHLWTQTSGGFLFFHHPFNQFYTIKQYLWRFRVNHVIGISPFHSTQEQSDRPKIPWMKHFHETCSSDVCVHGGCTILLAEWRLLFFVVRNSNQELKCSELNEITSSNYCFPQAPCKISTNVCRL